MLSNDCQIFILVYPARPNMTEKLYAIQNTTPAIANPGGRTKPNTDFSIVQIMAAPYTRKIPE